MPHLVSGVGPQQTSSGVRRRRHDTDSTVTASRAPWTRRDVAAIVSVLVLGAVARLVLLPSAGFRDDIDQFVGWVHHIATSGLGTLYGETAAGPVTFGPVMGYVWAILATADPAFRTVEDASDVGVRMLMKLPAVAADLGLAILVSYALRDWPRWAVGGAAAILLHPAVIDVSAWWGQYESIYLLSALAATVLAINGRNGWAAVAIAVSLMTKPQALPLVLPFAAWFWATSGVRGLARAAIAGAATIVVLWVPFIASGGPIDYIRNLGTYQNEIFNILSLRAWNAWWLVQELVAGGAFIVDGTALLGPVTPRHLGYTIAVVLNIAVAVIVLRDPRPRTLILALGTSVLVFFSFATQMHERYAFGAIVFLALLISEPRVRTLWLAFSVVFTFNLMAAVPPTPAIGQLLPVSGVLGIAGSIAMLAVTVAALRMLGAPPPDRVEARGSPDS
jgi:Gpi18-like mannosyltransferase